MKKLFSLMVLCLITTLTACKPKPLLPIPKGRILFSVQVAPYPFSDLNIYSINTDNSGAERLTNNPNNAISPVWSPDGTQIAFSSFDEGPKLFKMDANGDHQMSLTPIYPEGSTLLPSEAVAPDWSPDGRKIIFTAYYHIKELDLMSGRVSELATNSQQVQYPKWSPDGKKIMFISVDKGQVIIMNVDGTDQRQVNKSQAFSRLMDWSPDGRWVAVTDEDAISIMRPDGSQQRMITHQCELPYSSPSAAFSPDSQWLVMTCYGKEPGIYVINLEEGVLRKLIYDLPVEYFNGIDWAP